MTQLTIVSPNNMQRALFFLFTLAILIVPVRAQFKPTSPGKAIEDAARTAQTSPQSQEPTSPAVASVLNDMHGYNPKPYVEGAVFPRVRQQWFQAIPEFIADPNARNGVAVVEFRILRDGEVEDVRLTQTAGTPQMDEAAFQAVMRSSPFRPLPKAMPADHMQMKFHFYYRGKNSSKWWKQR